MSLDRLRLVILTLAAATIGQSSWALVVPGTVDIPTLITFSEVSPNTFNPVINAGGNTVRFGILFVGQSLGTQPNTLDDMSPDSPLILDVTAGTAATMIDLSSPTMPVLGSVGTNRTAFMSPLAIRFDNPVNSLAFDLGQLDASRTVTIKSFSEDGSTIGTFQNQNPDSNRVVLVEESGQNTIAGVSIFVADGEMDWEGFAVDNLGFDDTPPGEPVPEPGSAIIWVLLLGITATFGITERRGVKL